MHYFDHQQDFFLFTISGLQCILLYKTYKHWILLWKCYFCLEVFTSIWLLRPNAVILLSIVIKVRPRFDQLCMHMGRFEDAYTPIKLRSETGCGIKACQCKMSVAVNSIFKMSIRQFFFFFWCLKLKVLFEVWKYLAPWLARTCKAVKNLSHVYRKCIYNLIASVFPQSP